MSKERIQDVIRSRVLVFDGAMGTEIYRRNVFTNRCFDELCLSSAEMIRQIHMEYADAGADVLTTNSYGANREALAKYGFAERTEAVNVAAAGLCREIADAAPRPIFIAGSVGPIPESCGDPAKRSTLLVEQIRALLKGGADFILFETLPSAAVAAEAAGAVAALGPAAPPYMLSFAVDPAGKSAAGETLEQLLEQAAGFSPAPFAAGFNCGGGPDMLLGIVERAQKLTALPLVVQPNSGSPKMVENRQMYLCSPEYLTTYAIRYVNLGVRGVGGCCGTTPAHIREIARSIKPLVKQRFEIKPAAAKAGAALKDAVPLAAKSGLGAKFAAGQWVRMVELLPPRGYDAADIIAKAALCRNAGVDAINIPDGPRAAPRLSPLVTSLRVQQDAGIEAILHFCCRDRNLISMQADLLGCAACGIRNILCITGDPPKLGHYAFASGVFDADSIGLVSLVDRLNHGVDLAGEPIGEPTATLIGVGADPNALDFDREVARFREKVAAGAEFAITQPVFAVEPLFRFLDAVADTKIPVIAGVWPMASLRNATFMKTEVPGVVVPDSILERLGATPDRDAQRRIGIEIAREIVGALRHRVAGIQVSAPLGNVQTALEVIRGW